MYIYFIIVVVIVIGILIVGKIRMKKKRLKKREMLATRLSSSLKANKKNSIKIKQCIYLTFTDNKFIYFLKKIPVDSTLFFKCPNYRYHFMTLLKFTLFNIMIIIPIHGSVMLLQFYEHQPYMLLNAC